MRLASRWHGGCRDHGKITTETGLGGCVPSWPGEGQRAGGVDVTACMATEAAIPMVEGSIPFMPHGISSPASGVVHLGFATRQ